MTAPRLPLADQLVVVTRAAHQAGELRELLEARGATVFELPAISVQRVSGDELAKVDALAAEWAAGGFDALLLTSANAAKFFAERWQTQYQNTGAHGELTIFVIGPATARAATAAGLHVTATAKDAVGEGLVACVKQAWGADLAGRRFLFPHAREGRPTVAQQLLENGALVEEVVLYETVAATEGSELPKDRKVDWVTFASPSAVRGFMALGKIAKDARVACIGPVTAAAAREAGLNVVVEASEHTARALVDAMVELCVGRPVSHSAPRKR